MKTLYAATVLFFWLTNITVTAQAPDWQWAKSAGGQSSWSGSSSLILVMV